jgi:hypothetical protein
MPDIIVKRTPKNTDLLCGCDTKITTATYSEVDEVPVCSKCYEERYFDFVKCKAKGCIEHDHPEKFFDGLCPSHEEVKCN